MAKRINTFYENSVILRGIVLQSTIEVERKIDDYLSNYFCQTLEKKYEFSEHILFTDKMNLDAKRQVFVSILTKHQPLFINDNPKLIKALERIIPHRNVFAHLEISDDSRANDQTLKMEIIFKKYAAGKLKQLVYTTEKILTIKEDLKFINTALDYLLQEMPSLV